MDYNKHYTYILECSDGTLYTGYTNDLKKRIDVHNNKKGAKYTKYRVPVKLKYYEISINKSEAMKKEIMIKRLSRNKKLCYINENISLEKIKFIEEINMKKGE